MDPTAARGLRRASLVALTGGTALIAHAHAAGPLRLVAIAPLLWIGLVALATFGRPHRGSFRRHGAAGIAWRVLAVQAALHVLMHGAPWAFGIVPHHATPLLTPGLVVAHAAAAVVIVLILRAVEGLLHLACAARRVIAALVLRVAPGDARRGRRLPAVRAPIASGPARLPGGSRAPPPLPA